MSDAPERYADPDRNRLLNKAVSDLEVIINQHDPDIDVPVMDGVWNRLDKLALDIEDHAEPTPAQIMAAALTEYNLEHVTENMDERIGRRSAVRGMMVRLGKYTDFINALDQLKEPKT